MADTVDTSCMPLGSSHAPHWLHAILPLSAVYQPPLLCTRFRPSNQGGFRQTHIFCEWGSRSCLRARGEYDGLMSY